MAGFAVAAIAEKAVADERRIGDDQGFASPQLTQFRRRYAARDKAVADVGPVGGKAQGLFGNQCAPPDIGWLRQDDIFTHVRSLARRTPPAKTLVITEAMRRRVRAIFRLSIAAMQKA